MALRTIIVLSCSVKTNKTNNIPIGIALKIDTDPKLIREIMRTGYIKGIYPLGPDFTIEEKIHATDCLLNDQTHIPQKIHKILNEKKKTKRLTNSKEIKLTQRQQQILDLIVNKGASNKLIARILNISESTVKLHMTQILKKYGVTNRTQLALFAQTKTKTAV